MKRIILLNKQWNYEKIQVDYNLSSKNICISTRYTDIERGKTYQKTEKGKKIHQKACEKYRQTGKQKIVQKRYRQSEKGKNTRRKHIAKRRRNLQWIQMFENPFDENVKIDWHHINDIYVIAIPRELHRLHLGKFHREKTMEIIKQIYLGRD